MNSPFCSNQQFQKKARFLEKLSYLFKVFRRNLSHQAVGEGSIS